MKNKQEFTGTLVGFDDFVNVVLTDVQFNNKTYKKMLLNGANITMLIPGGL
jgi:U6 snRNA-associated Sm-like protein LSm5